MGVITFVAAHAPTASALIVWQPTARLRNAFAPVLSSVQAPAIARPALTAFLASHVCTMMA